MEQGSSPEHRGIAALDPRELDQCVHCGLCLNHCPTYRVLRTEADSPRGRIHLVRALAEGRLAPTERFRRHFDLCLLCRACESACPSGVPYGRIAEHARELLGPPGSRLARAVLNWILTRCLPFPGRLRTAGRLLKLYQRTGLRALVRPLLPLRLRQLDAMLPGLAGRFFESAPGRFPPQGPQRARVSMLNGCIMPLLFADAQRATVRVFQRNGCEVIFPQDQTCCGALNLHNGETRAAKEMARRNIDVFLATAADAVLVNAAGCGAVMKEYGRLFDDEPSYRDRARRFSERVKDAAEFLSDLGLTAPLGRVDLVVTYQDPCHLAHGQRIRRQPRDLLRAVPGLQLVEMGGADHCCGSAGIYNITQPGMARRLLQEKIDSIAATGARAVVAPNPGCMLQLRYGSQSFGYPLEVFHLMELLDRACAAPEGRGEGFR